MKMQTFHRHVVFLVHFAQETHSAKYYKVLTTSRCSQNFVIFCTVSFLDKMYKKNNMPLKCLHFHFFYQSIMYACMYSSPHLTFSLRASESPLQDVANGEIRTMFLLFDVSLGHIMQ